MRIGTFFCTQYAFLGRMSYVPFKTRGKTFNPLDMSTLNPPRLNGLSLPSDVLVPSGKMSIG